jgi:hypothetical protein
VEHYTAPLGLVVPIQNIAVSQVVGWAHCCKDFELVEACAAKVHSTLLQSTTDALSWEPAPKTLRDILWLPHRTVQNEWLNSVKRELETLVDSNTFSIEDKKDNEVSTPVMEMFKVKIKSDGSLDKLKTRLGVCRDLQDKSITKDKWLPTASFCCLKMFLAHASRLKVHVRQLDFIGAFLQAKMRTRMFITIPKIYRTLFPEYDR